MLRHVADPPTRSKPNGAELIVEGLSRQYGDFFALRDISMKIGAGQIVVIIGGSGAGKSTLLKILIGLDKPTAGKILVNGQDIVPLGDRQLSEVRKKFGMVFQYAALLDSLNVLENLAFPLREHTKLGTAEIRDRVREKLSILDLGDIEDRFPSQLSGGMRKRVGLARALMLEPEVILYDEPTSGLDPLSSRLVDDLIVETRDRFGVTSVVISHDMAGALKIADYLYILSHGEFAGKGTPAEIIGGASDLAVEFVEASGIAAERLIQRGPQSKRKKPRRD